MKKVELYLEIDFQPGVYHQIALECANYFQFKDSMKKFSYRVIVGAFVVDKSPVRCDDVNVNPSHSFWLIYLVFFSSHKMPN